MSKFRVAGSLELRFDQHFNNSFDNMGPIRTIKSFDNHMADIASTSSTMPAGFVPTAVGKKQSSSTRPRSRTTRRESLKYRPKNLEPKNQSQYSDDCRGKPSSSLSQSTMQQIRVLEWMFEEDSYRHNDMAWRQIENQQTFSSDCRTPLIQPQWDEPPSRDPLWAIDDHLLRLAQAWRAHAHLQIPASWSVFENINWLDSRDFELAHTDTDNPTSTSDSSESSSNSSCGSASPVPSKAVIACRGREITRPRARGEWNTVTTMNHIDTHWKYQTRERALRRDEARHTGHIDLNQDARNHDIWAHNSFPVIMSYSPSNGRFSLLPDVRELSLSRTIGRWLAIAVATDMFPAQFEQPVRWPRYFRVDTSLVSRCRTDRNPVIDYTCRATTESMGWQEEMCPLLFAVHFSPHNDISRCNPDSAFRKLASAFRPMMTLFILYYLDTRKSTEESLPPWMVLFGITYDEQGILIRGHSPCFQPFTKSSCYKGYGWRAYSFNVDNSDCEIMTSALHLRGPLLSKLNRIQGHCKYVMERLKSWQGYEQACRLLML